jgi:protease I
MKHKEKGDTFKVDRPLNSADPNDFDGLLLPSGEANSGRIAQHADAVSFVRNDFR